MKIANLTKSSGGNTKNPRCRSWCFTWNNYENIKILEKKLNDIGNYVFQEETGDNGTKHLQGVVNLKNQKTFNQVKSIEVKAHWEPCRNLKKSIEYCTKLDTRTGNVFTNMDITYPESLDNEYKSCTPKAWQIEIEKLINEKPDSRKIYWFWESTGNVGKSVFTRHLVMTRKDCIVLSGKAADMKFAIQACQVKPKIVIFDLSRDMENKISYQGMEEIKNGCFFSSKYEGGMVIMNKPHIIVFANWEPNYNKLSPDRWVVKNIADVKINDGIMGPQDKLEAIDTVAFICDLNI